MSFAISESLAYFQHRLCLRELPVSGMLPLDGSDWCRLVNMRLRRERQPGVKRGDTDFLTMVHSRESPLPSTRASSKRAVLHWFLKGEETYDAFWSFRYQPAGAYTSLQALSRAGTLLDTLSEAERQWDTDVEKRLGEDDTTDFWLTNWSEYWESRPVESFETKQRKMIVDKQKKSLESRRIKILEEAS